MGITASEVFRLAARYGPKKVHEQSLLLARFVEEKLDVIDQPGQTGYVTVKSGGLEATGYIADQATLPTGDAVDPTQLYYTPKYLFTRLRLPRGGLDLVRDIKDGVRLIIEELESAAADVARQKGRAVFSKALGSPAASASSGTATFTITDVAGLRKGAQVDLYTSAGAFRESAVIDYVDWTTGPIAGGTAYTVNLTANKALTWATTDVLYLRGSKANGIVSIADAASTDSLYGHAATSDEWSGNKDSTTTTLSETAMRRIHDQIRNRRGMPVDCIVMNPVTLTRYMNLHTDQRRFYPGDTLDKYGSLRPAFDGVEIFPDENCGAKDVLFFNKRDYKIHRFRKFGPETDGGKSAGMNMAAAMLSQSAFVYDVQMWEAMEARVTCRNGLGHMSAIAA